MGYNGATPRGVFVLRALSTGLLVLGLALGCVQDAAATSMIHLSSEEQALLSHAIVEATIGSHDTIAFPDGRVYTDSTLHVTAVINGDAPQVLNVRQWGGEHAGLIHEVPGDARLAPGDKVVAMIRQVDGIWYLTAMAQSVWYIEGDGSDARVTRDVLGLGLYEDTIDGTKPLPQTPLEFAYLQDLRAALSQVPMGEAP